MTSRLVGDAIKVHTLKCSFIIALACMYESHEVTAAFSVTVSLILWTLITLKFHDINGSRQETALHLPSDLQ